MSLRTEIEKKFQGKAFHRPLFYSYAGGLRFELSEGGTAIGQVLCALRKAAGICSDIFDPNGDLVVCLRFWSNTSLFAHRQMISELHSAEIFPTQGRCIWAEAIESEDRCEAGEEEWWVNIAFKAPTSLLQNLLWCAFSSDFGDIRPRPGCMVYLFDLEKEVMVWPYDDRGMDVVGENRKLLSTLYVKHNRYLLDHARPIMDADFAGL